MARVDGVDLRFPESADSLLLPAAGSRLELLLGSVEPFVLVSCSLSGDAPMTAGSGYVLSPFESRFLADNGFPHPVRGARAAATAAAAACAGLVTDLHSHFAGCVGAHDLLRIGLECGVTFPRPLLAEAGIHAAGSDALPLADLPAHLLDGLRASLEIPLDRQTTFADMERIYRLRTPLTKHPRALLPLCRQIARDYARMGIQYAELSISNVVEAGRLRALHSELPAIEEESGVRLRFLAALSRHDDLEWDLDYIDRLRELAGSRVLVGLDFMGHETNSTRAFARQLREVAVWADRARPGFALRVHAGENPAHPENVRVAVESVLGFDVRLRIGHGLYGVDEATLDLLRSSGTIVEFNLNSNFALNNIQTSREAPLLRYVRAGVPIVLGTDGYGIYQTSPEMEARVALLSGLAEQDFAAIRRTEAAYVEARTEYDARWTPEPREFRVPADSPNRLYSPHILARRAAEMGRRDRALSERLSALGIPLLDQGGLARLLAGRRCLSFAGAWAKSWDRISPPNQERVRSEIARLFDALAPEEVVVVSGGTRFGVEGIVQEHARRRGCAVLGTLVSETPPTAIEAGTVTHAYVVAEKLHGKAAGLYALLKEQDGFCVFIGGGAIVSDEIQTAGNLRVPYLLMDGPEGASTEHARQQPGRAFTRAEEVLEALRGTARWVSVAEPYWQLGPNPTVDIVLTRREPVPGRGRRQVLLIRREANSPTEPGKWALPGGFQHTDAPRGAPWVAGRESEAEACLRELREEAGLDLTGLEARLLRVGEYEGGGRDPRDTPTAWSRSTVFAFELPDALATAPIAGGDDASDARWMDLDGLPPVLAFDHARILADVKRLLRW